MKRLILNADDFGLTDRVSAGIVETLRRGLVSSTTAMVAAPGAPAHLARWAPEIRGHIGLHLQLTGGRPSLAPASVPSLVDESGSFPRSARTLGRPAPDEAAREWRAQVEQLRDLGIEPTHLDSHHHVHMLPALLPVFLDLAKSLRLPVRSGTLRVKATVEAAGVVTADRCETTFYGGVLDARRFVELVEKSFEILGQRGTVEVMCHPGYADEVLAKVSMYVKEREEELALFCSPELAGRLAEAEITIVGMEALRRDQPQSR